MKEPRRLRVGGADKFERDLLASSEADVPSAQAYQRTVATLGVGLLLPLSAAGTAQGAGVSAVALPSAKLGALALGKWLAMGAVAGVVTASGARLTTQALSPASEPRMESHRVTARKTERPPVVVEERPLPLVPPPTVLAPEIAVDPSKSSGEARPAVAPAPEPQALALPNANSFEPLVPESRAGSLQGEVKRLEEARRLLRRGDARSALASLERYAAEFPTGALSPEARVLEVSALLELGERERAQALGRSIIVRDPQGPHAQAVRSLLSESHKP